jgi:hypothetical protein
MMSKERELLKGAVEWMHELKYAWVEERNSGDRDLLDLVADINKIEQLLNNPEQGLYDCGLGQKPTKEVSDEHC